MRIRILALSIVSLLTASHPSVADEAQIPQIQRSDAQASSVTDNRRAWEFDGALLKSLSGQDTNQIGGIRLMARRFLTDALTMGADFRYWPSGSYPLGEDAATAAWAAGGVGQLYLFKSAYIGAYLGGSLLWVPARSEAAFTPEVGFKWFASQRFAIGISYSILTDLVSYTTSFEPPASLKSRQSLGIELSVFL